MKIIINILLLIVSVSFVHAQRKAKNYDTLVEAHQHPDSVEWLTLRDAELLQFPLEILEFRNLKYLDLSNNNISSLPEAIGQLQNLFYLDLSGNHISALPKAFSKIKIFAIYI